MVTLHDLKPDRDYGALSDAALMELWRKMRFGNPQRLFVYSECRARGLPFGQAPLLDRLQFRLRPGETPLFRASSSWRKFFCALNLASISSASIFLWPCFFLGLALLSALLAGGVFSPITPFPGPEMKEAVYLVSILLALSSVVWPFSSVGFFLTDRRIGRSCLLFNCLPIWLRWVEWRDVYVLGWDLEVYPHPRVVAKSLDELGSLCGSFYFLSRDLRVMSFGLRVSKALAFLNILQAVRRDDGPAGRVFPRERFYPPAWPKGVLAEYYRAVAGTGWFHNDSARVKRTGPIRELGAYFAGLPTPPGGGDPVRERIKSGLEPDEAYIFRAPCWSQFRRRLIVFTDRRLLLADRSGRVLSAHDQADLQIAYNIAFIMIRHNGRLVGVLPRTWFLVPDLETLTEITGRSVTPG